MDWVKAAGAVAGCAVLMLTSGFVVKRMLRLTGAKIPCQLSGAEKPKVDLGTVIGKCENILVITFVLGGEFTALAVVFAGKSILRAEDIRGNPEYYLGGTLVNFTYSLVWSLLLRHILAQL
jgi:hypothetical protein